MSRATCTVYNYHHREEDRDLKFIALCNVASPMIMSRSQCVTLKKLGGGGARGPCICYTVLYTMDCNELAKSSGKHRHVYISRRMSLITANHGYVYMLTHASHPQFMRSISDLQSKCHLVIDTYKIISHPHLQCTSIINLI